MQASDSTEPAPVEVNFNSVADADPDERSAAVQGITRMRDATLRRDELRRDADDAFAALTPRERDQQTGTFADDNPKVVAARTAAEAEQAEFLETALSMPRFAPGAEVVAGISQPSTDADVANEIFAIPYHYDWRWSNGAILTSHQPDLPTGRVSVGVWAKPLARAHAGFGVVVRAERDHWVTARSLRRSTERGHIWTSGVYGAKTVAEGGTEMTVFDGDQRLGTTRTEPPWHIELEPGFFGPSGTKTHDTGGNVTSAPLELNWEMKRGRSYHLNVGAWVYAYWRQGDGGGDTASASAIVVADVLAITLTHH